MEAFLHSSSFGPLGLRSLMRNRDFTKMEYRFIVKIYGSRLLGALEWVHVDS